MLTFYHPIHVLSYFQAGANAQSREAEADSVGWDWLEEEWPLSERPKVLQSREKVARMSITDITALHKNYLMKVKNAAKEKAKAKGAGKVSKDVMPAVVTFPEGIDDSKEALHPARWSRLPIIHPKKWWSATPTTRNEIFKAMPLKFYGADNAVGKLQ